MNKKDEQKNKRLFKTYGILLEEFNEMAKDGCMICGSKEYVLCVDHIHQKGFKKMGWEEKRKYVRGVLCYKCNTAIKGFDKTKNGIENRQRLNGTFVYFQIYNVKGEI